MLILTIGTSSITEARKIGRELVKRRLAACCQWHSLESSFRWKGKVVNGREATLTVHTTATQIRKIVSLVKSMHTYDVPSIQVMNQRQKNPAYQAWLEAEVRR